MNTREFKRNVSLIAGKVIEKIKHQTKNVVKACSTGIVLVMAEPDEPGQNVLEKEKGNLQFQIEQISERRRPMGGKQQQAICLLRASLFPINRDKARKHGRL